MLLDSEDHVLVRDLCLVERNDRVREIVQQRAELIVANLLLVLFIVSENVTGGSELHFVLTTRCSLIDLRRTEQVLWLEESLCYSDHLVS